MYKVSETNIYSTYILRIADLSCSSDSDKMSRKATSKKSEHLEGKVGAKKYTFLRCIFSRIHGGKQLTLALETWRKAVDSGLGNMEERSRLWPWKHGGKQLTLALETWRKAVESGLGNMEESS